MGSSNTPSGDITNPYIGQQWYNNSTGKSYIYQLVDDDLTWVLVPCCKKVSFFPPSIPQVCGTGIDWDALEDIDGKNKNGKVYYTGVNVEVNPGIVTTPAVNSFTQSKAEYTYNGAGPLILSNFTVTANLANFSVTPILDSKVEIRNTAGYTYDLLINSVVKSTIIFTGKVSPETGTDKETFTINPGDKIVVRATINPGHDDDDYTDDISYEWCLDIAC